MLAHELVVERLGWQTSLDDYNNRFRDNACYLMGIYSIVVVNLARVLDLSDREHKIGTLT